MRIKDKAVAWALALCAVIAMGAALSAPAGAETYGNGYKLARFKIEVKGWQKTVQQHTHARLEACDHEDYSSGTELISFKSKPFVITASYYPGEDNPSFFSAKSLAIPTVAKVKRSYTPRTTNSSGAGCEENGGGIDTTTYQPDCGTKTVKPFSLELAYAPDKAERDKLLLSTYSAPEDPFERCPGAGGQAFPNLITVDEQVRYIGAELTPKELFDPRFEKWISLAHGSQKNRYSDWWAETTLDWDVSFTRLKTKAPGN
jgi:hypothetical protein